MWPKVKERETQAKDFLADRKLSSPPWALWIPDYSRQRDGQCEMGETSEPRVFSPNNHKKEESDRGASDTFPPTSTTTLACEPGHKSTGMLKECQGRGPPAPLQRETLKSRLSRQLPQRQSPCVQQNSAE